MTAAVETPNPSAPRRTLEYVGALDGLRALAVAAVIVYHFAPKRMPAGFLGVDVFFVVSGFLIARLVVGEIVSKGNVSLSNFWARRARRLLPALVTVTVAIVVAAAVSFNKTEMHDVRANALGTLFYVANWVLLHTQTSYFATTGRPTPFLHMWSLAVEEQFYVVLPLVCFVARRAIVRRPNIAAIVALAGAVASSVWMYALTSPHGDPSRAYWGSDTHAMGLLVGVALGVMAGTDSAWHTWAAKLQSSARAQWVATMAAAVALAAIVVAMVRTHETSFNLYRGGFLLFSLATGVVIVVVVMLPNGALSRFFAWRPLVEIGLRSYSLYLWHWPVRVFVTENDTLHGASLFLVRLAISVVLAEISFRVIEGPFRVGAIARRSGSRGALAYFAAGSVVAGVLVVTVAAPPALPPSSLSNAATVNPDASLFHVDTFGDSTALVFGYNGAVHSTELGLAVGGDAQLGCGVVNTEHLSGSKRIPLPSQCNGWQDRWREWMRKDPHAVLALMDGAWDVLDHHTAAGDVRFPSAAWTELVTTSVRDALSLLRSDGRHVYVFQVPCYGAGDPQYPLPERNDPKRQAAVNDIFASVARELGNISMVTWRDFVCPGGRRVEKVGRVDLWASDDVHLSEGGAVEVWKWWLPQVRPPS